MREIGRPRRLRGPAAIGVAAMVAMAVGGIVAATQAQAANGSPASGHGLSVSREFFGDAVEPYTGKETPSTATRRPQPPGPPAARTAAPATRPNSRWSSPTP